jgi:anthranilate synthase component 2
MRLLLIDNYDSFTYNVKQTLSCVGDNIDIDVIRNDEISVAEVKDRIQNGYENEQGNKIEPYKAIVISPGPGRPSDAGITMDLIRELGPDTDSWQGIPIFGVCLGHQAIGEVFGGNVILAPQPVHGKTSEIYHQNKGIFSGLTSHFTATRYHSLIVDWDSLPEDLEVTAWTDDNLIMGLRHKKYHWIQGVQFHPESILTKEEHREILYKNFLSLLEKTESTIAGWEM